MSSEVADHGMLGFEINCDDRGLVVQSRGCYSQGGCSRWNRV